MADSGGVTVLRTGAANLASVVAALERAQQTIRWADSAQDVVDAGHVVLPGVGAFGPAMARLRADGFVQALRTRIEQGQPTLAVCLGLQLLGAGSDESPNVEGLGVFSQRAVAFGGGLRVPQLGWNRVEPAGDWLTSDYAYFANSYFLAEAPVGWAAAYSTYGSQRLVAAIGRRGVLACQFHPELSGPWGQALVERWLAGGWPC
ncbi:MAG: imidazole glycerol phosphate synthase subunit HisH [Deltaproteobacteria bacterium]|nr:imidazole glycerol phosphate synthase subunit HisH [Deltaproteobacteria bacterium]